jgi:hypothetical protein
MNNLTIQARPSAAMASGNSYAINSSTRAPSTSESEFAALETVGEFRVIDAHEMQHRRMQVMNGNRVLMMLYPTSSVLANGDARLHAAAGQPHCECARVMKQS